MNSKIKEPLLASYTNNLIECGCDEAGRGCLAGPVFAAAVIFPKGYYHPLLNDSKQLKHDKRMQLREVIEKDAITFAIASSSVALIDEINILNANFKAMHEAIDNLKIQPELLLIDGNRFPAYPNIPHQCIVKGDSKYIAIAAASILAKTYRDECMLQLANEFPQYQWEINKGYGTAAHRALLQEHGMSIHHRKSFKVKSII